MPEPRKNQKKSTKELKNKLREKLREKQLERTSKYTRNNRMDSLEEKIEESKNPTETRKLKQELALLEKIQEKEFKSFSGEFPEYGDSCDYGGSMERPG